MHPFVLFFLRDFCRRNGWDLDWLLACMDEDGNEWMPEGTALEIEELSSGEVPLKCWPRILPEPRLTAGLLPGEEPPMSPRAAAAAKAKPPKTTKPREGRPPKNPGFPLYAWFREKNRNAIEFGEEQGIAHQRISYYVNGLRAIPRELADKWERVTDGAVSWKAWPIVHNQKTGRYWSHGEEVHASVVREVRHKLLAASRRPKKNPS